MPFPKHVLNAIQHQAMREFRRTDFGRLVGQIESRTNAGGASGRELMQLARQLGRLGSRRGLERAVASTEIGKVVAQVDRYAKRGLKNALLDEVMASLGPLGSLIKTILRPTGKPLQGTNRELQAASDLLRSFGYRVERPATPARAQENLQTEADRARAYLERLGFTVSPPGEGPTRIEDDEEPVPITEVERATPAGKVVVKAGGIEFHVAPDDPLLTGRMLAVSSSNVHSIGYEWNSAQPMNGTLKVRFLDKRGDSVRAGATYAYRGIQPALFQDMRRAASKGRWVWDNLRIRGTKSGHRFAYQLSALASTGYVPRRATRRGNEEYFVPRTVTSKQGNIHRSALKEEFAGFWRDRGGGPNRGRPNRGTPNRGGPNRGRPNRG